MKKSITLMIPLKGESEYYFTYNKQFWSMLNRATFNSDYEINVFLMLFEREPLSDLINRILDDWKQHGSFCELTYFIISYNKGPCRGTLLKKAYENKKTNFYLFIDFDDILDENYFKDFIPDNDSDMIIGKAVRYKDGVKIPKDYLIWRPKDNETKNSFFSSSRYGNCIWNRFLSKNLVEKVLQKNPDISEFDNNGWGEEYCLHHSLFTNSNKIGYCNSLYLWNYGNLNTQSKNIDKSIANYNILKSLKYLPKEIQEENKDRYEKLLDTCISAI